MAYQGNEAPEYRDGYAGAGFPHGSFEYYGFGFRGHSQRSAGTQLHHIEGEVAVGFLSRIFRPNRSELEREREETRGTKGQLAAKVVELENSRYRLDEMVRRSLELLEHK